MNYTTAVMLINRNIRAVKATYEEKGPATLFKTLDQTIAVDDLVVVVTDTRHKMTVVKVTEVDVDVDFGSATPVSWVVDRVDPIKHENLINEEARAVSVIKAAELRNKREEMASKLLALKTDELDKLSIAHMGEPAALADHTIPGAAA